MAGNGANRGRQPTNAWRIAGWSVAAALILTPLVAMQFTAEVNWTFGDFVFAFIVIGGTGLLFELALTASLDRAYRAGMTAALAACFVIVWVNAAVGMIGNEDNSYNLLFPGVIAIALASAVAVRFRAAGMVGAMLAAAAAQLAIAAGGFATDPRGAILSAVVAAPWLVSAALFRTAAARSS